MRLIDADKLFQGTIICAPTFKHVEIAQKLMEEVKNAPTVDAEPVRHGKWIKGMNYDGIYEWQCSVCKRGWTHRTDKDICDEKYCYNCGAKMEKEED